MHAEDAARETAAGVGGIPARFMFDGKTYARGGELGFTGIDFYVVGRGGVLGPVDADVVTAAFVWFEPVMIRSNWEAGTAACPPDRAAVAWSEAAHAWGETHLPDDVDAARLAELAGRVVDAASLGGAPLFAGWRRLPLPEEPKALALHHLNGLRELRGALHAGAALAAGLRPFEALLVKTPHMASLFGWGEPYPDVSGLTEQWQQAEEGTNRALAPAYSALDDSERDELVALVAAADEATA